NRGGTRKNDAAHASISGGDQNVKCAVNVDLIRFDGLLHRTRNGSPGSKMKYIVCATAGAVDCGSVGDCAANQFDLIPDAGKILLLAGRQVVENGHRLAPADQFINGI